MQFIARDQSPFVAASHEPPDRPGVLKRVIATAGQFQGGHVQMLNWARLPGRSSFQPHYHEDMQEVFVLLSGDVEMQCGDERVRMAAGDSVLVDAGEVHRMQNLSDADADYLVFGISAGRNGRTVVVAELT